MGSLEFSWESCFGFLEGNSSRIWMGVEARRRERNPFDNCRNRLLHNNIRSAVDEGFLLSNINSSLSHYLNFRGF